MGLPSALLRFPDLKRVGINNWPSLKSRIEDSGFPPGRYIGRNRVWTPEEVEGPGSMLSLRRVGTIHPQM